MPELSLERAVSQNARVTIECEVIEPRSILHDIQECNPGIELLEDQQLHLTLFHLGKIRELISELSKASALPSRTVQLNLEQYLNSAVVHHPNGFPREMVLKVANFAAGGSWYKAIVLSPSPGLEDYRSWIRGGFLDLLRAGFEIASADAWLAHSPAISEISPTWLPHITLQRSSVVDGARWRSAPSLSVSLSQPQVRGVSSNASL